MKKRLGMVMMFGVVSSCIALSAVADIKGSGVAVVDVHAVIRQSPQVKAFKDQIEKKFGDRRKKLEARHRALAKKEEKLKREAQVMDAHNREVMARQLEKESVALHKDETAFQKDFFMKRNKELTKLFKKIKKIVKKIAEKRHISVVLDQSNVLYLEPSLNLTKPVVDALAK